MNRRSFLRGLFATVALPAVLVPMAEKQHLSSCATCNAPAFEPGPCDCAGYYIDTDKIRFVNRWRLDLGPAEKIEVLHISYGPEGEEN